MKGLKVFTLLLCAAMLLLSCSKQDKEEDSEQEVTASLVIEALEEKLKKRSKEEYVRIDLLVPEEVEYFSPMKHLDPALMKEGYAIKGKQVTQSALIIIIEAVGFNEASQLEEGLDRVLSDQMGTWSDYIPSEYDYVKNNMIEREGNFIAYITSRHVDMLKEDFEKTVK